MGNALNVCGASVILYENGKILLQKRADNHCWCYHGGRIEVGESAEEAAARELYEETGLMADSLQLLGVFSGKALYHIYPDGNEVYIIDIVYLCTKYSGTIRMQVTEVEQLQWFPLDAIPDNISPPTRPGMNQFLSLVREGTLPLLSE